MAIRSRWSRRRSSAASAALREAWLAVHPEFAGLEASFEVVGFRDGRLERIRQAF